MKIKIINNILAVFLILSFGFIPNANAQTIPIFDQFVATTTPVNSITQRVYARPIKITGLTNGANLCLDANGLVTTTGCTGGGGGGGTVTSVSMTTPLGLSVSGSPITTSGTLALTLTSGYNIPLTASTTQWNNFYNASTSLPYVTSITAGSGLAGGTITTSGTISLDLTAANIWSGIQTFNGGLISNASSSITKLTVTNGTTTNATTSNLTISGLATPAGAFIAVDPNGKVIATTTPSGTAGNLTGAVTSVGLATSLGSFNSSQLSTALTDETGTGAAVFNTSPFITTPIIVTNARIPIVIGGPNTNSTLTLQSTSGVGATGADIVFKTGNNGATEDARILNYGGMVIGISATTTNSLLEVNGTTTATVFVATSTTASSTFAGPAVFSGVCVTGDTKLKRRKKRQDSEEYDYDFIEIKDVQVGDEIESYDEVSKTMVYREVIALADQGEQSILGICTSLGYSIKSTYEHPFLTPDGWKAAKEMNMGCEIGVSHNNSFAWDYISKISLEPTERVYDIQIKDTKNFVGNNIIAHNSSISSASFAGGIIDSTGSAGTNGQVLQTNGSATTWVATSTLGLGGSGGGTVTSITAGTGLTGGVITTAGTIALDLTAADIWSGLQTFNGGYTAPNGTTTNATSTNFDLSGNFYDSTNSAGINGYVLQTTGSATQWVATSSLGISGGAASGSTGDIQINNGGVFGTLGGLRLNTTGNARGTSAFDMQSNRSAVTQVASALQSIAIGSYNTSSGGANTNDGCAPFASVAIGIRNLASGQNSVAVGSGNCSTTNSVVFGEGNNGANGAGITIGLSNVSAGGNETLVGTSNTAGGNYSSVFGYCNIGGCVGGNTGTLAVGYKNIGCATWSDAVGICNISRGPQSTAFGYKNTASANYSSAFGYCNLITVNTATSSSAFGFKNTICTASSTVVGFCNSTTASSTNMFGSNMTNNFATSTMIGSGDTAKLTIFSTGQYASTSTVPAIAAGTGAGTSPTIAISGNANGGTITLTTGTLPAGTNATIATITYPTACPFGSSVTFSPANANAAGLGTTNEVYMTENASTATLVSGTTGLTAATQYIWNYQLNCF